ncbi:MAG: class I SAM-dependent methyltransferase [Anaerolineales bacterium]|nr:class I SAM-dependent methyltransferase [Anaerolineales bacterium]
MSEFNNSNWARPEYSREYRETADQIIPERQTLLRITASFYRNAIRDGRKKRILDLGCGDGILGQILSQQDGNAEIILADGSAEMLASARERLSGVPNAEFLQSAFADVISGVFRPAPFDFIASAFAIHHLELPDKARLFQAVNGLLKPGGYFLDIDAAESETFAEWYYLLWKEWILAHEELTRPPESAADVPARARAKPENHYDSLRSQMDALTGAGFMDVECHYKYGIFAVFGGRKAGGAQQS